eukprot:101014-Pleurochrysis_carterae.AAC.6
MSRKAQKCAHRGRKCLLASAGIRKIICEQHANSVPQSRTQGSMKEKVSSACMSAYGRLDASMLVANISDAAVAARCQAALRSTHLLA